MEDWTPTERLRAIEIIKDIIKKRPEEHGCTYSIEEYYDYDRNYDRKRVVPNKPLFGHDPSELTALGLGNGGWRIQELMHEIYEYKAITQKMNRFDERIVGPLRTHVSNVGIPGLYSVRTSTTDVGHVYAQNLADATKVADVTYGFLISGKTDRWGDQETLRVRFSSQGTVADLAARNQHDVKCIKTRIAKAKEVIEQSMKTIERCEAELMAIQMSELSQLDMGLSDNIAHEE